MLFAEKVLVLILVNIAFTYNVKKNLPSTDPDAQYDAEFDSPTTINGIVKALQSGGHKVIKIEADEKAYLKLYKYRKKIDIVFNIAEGYSGSMREAHIPAMCEVLRLPYTHSSALIHAISLDKTVTKEILMAHDIRTPRFQLFYTWDEPLKKLRFPIILKPNAEGSSKGIMNANLVKNEDELRKRLKFLLKNFKQQILAEEFLTGREFTVGMLGNPPRVLPIIEQIFDKLPPDMAPFSSYEMKWLWEDSLSDLTEAYRCPAKLTKSLQKKIEDICIATWNVLDVRDVTRVDVRLDSDGEPNVLEINSLPGIVPPDIPGIYYLPLAAKTAGISYNKLILEILNAAIKRWKIK